MSVGAGRAGTPVINSRHWSMRKSKALSSAIRAHEWACLVNILVDKRKKKGAGGVRCAVSLSKSDLFSLPRPLSFGAPVGGQRAGCSSVDNHVDN